MNQYKAIVRLYVSDIRPKTRSELDWFRHQSSLKAAIVNAATATNSQNKRYSHQRRLKKSNLEMARLQLLSNIDSIKKCKSFDSLFSLLEGMLLPISGLGELYVYDTALRIGAKLGCLPQKVYLHAGTRVGAKALGFSGKDKTLEMSELPRGFHDLEPHELEDVLCIFKDEFAGKPATKRKRSWCE